MGLLVKIILILTLHQICLDSNILDEENVKLSLQYLCPGVDICNRSEYSPRVNPNEIDGQGYTSCCHSCSCHKDCHINSNCCYPDDREAKSNGNTSIVNINAHIERRNSSLMIDRILKIDENASIDTNATTNATANGVIDIKRGNKTKNQEQITVDKTNLSSDIDLAIKQCMYIRTGSADESWIGWEPAVRIVTTPPQGGCTSNTICPTLTQQSKQATCNSGDIFPWGDLFPVYSADYELIFKNELCACCYGVLEYTPWIPFVTCDNTDNYRNIPISEHFSFLQPSNKLSSYCSVTFRSVESREIVENKCFVETIGKCPFRENYFPRVPDGVNLTRSEIVKACTRGPDAPVTLHNRVFKNVFCAMCNNNVLFNHLQCFAEEKIMADKGFGANAFTYLLDAATVKKFTQVGKMDEVFPTPIACLKSQGVWIEESCRDIHCPSGQTRMDGVCTFPSKRWIFQDGIEATVNLRYVTTNTSVLKMIHNGEVMTDDVEKAFKKTSPWPFEWNIIKILHTSKDNNISPQMAVYLRTKISLSEKLMFQVKSSLRRQWNILLGGMGITFEQSFMKYEIHGWKMKPNWFKFAHELESFINVSVNNSMSFENILPWFASGTIPYSLNKLVTCEQVSLSKYEYTTMAEGLVLLNKLTNETLFSLEFDRVEDGDGELVPRICLADSPFVSRRENNAASSICFIRLNLFWAIYILKWTVKLYCA